MNRPLLTIVGGGPGGPALLTAEAKAAIRRAGRVYAAPRLAESLSSVAKITPASLEEIRRGLRQDHADATVVVSGDVGFYSLAGSLARELAEVYQVRLVSGVSSLQALCGRLGVPWQDAAILSLHGQPGRLARVPGLATFHRTSFLLTGGPADVASVLELLAEMEVPGLTVTVGENLSAPGERVVTGPPEKLRGESFPGLSVLLLQNPDPAESSRRLRDGDFMRDNTPMTKEPVRCYAVNCLDLRPADTVWDIGAGTGSVAAAMAQRANQGRVFAVERDRDAVRLCRENRRRLGLYNIFPVEGAAPAALADLPAPDAVFAGGSGGALESIVRTALARNPDVRLCWTAVTLETLSQSLALEALGLELEIACIQVSTAGHRGQYHLMQAQNPVYVIGGRRKG